MKYLKKFENFGETLKDKDHLLTGLDMGLL